MTNLDAVNDIIKKVAPQGDNVNNVMFISSTNINKKSETHSKDIEIFDWCLKQYQLKNSFINGQRNQFITALSHFCNEYGVSHQTCLNECLKRYIQSDFTANEIESTVQSVYKNHLVNHGTKQFVSKQEFIQQNKQTIKNETIIVPDFPIDIFPVEIQYFINELKGKKALPHDFICGAVLSAFSTASGKKFIIKHDNYDNFAGTWIALIGESGTNKSEPLKICYEPFAKHDRILYEKWINECIEHAAIKDNKTPKPLLKINKIDDITIETLYDCFNGNEHGLCSYVDELMGWILDMERYGNNSTQTKYLSIWNNIEVTYMRKTQKLRIDKPFLNVVGGIQPDLLKDLANGNRAKDGTIYRILSFYPDRVLQSKKSGILDENLLKDYENYIFKLLLTDFDFWESGLQTKSKLVYIRQGDAAKLFESYIEKLRNRLNSLPECAERKYISKLQIYLYRFALLLHLIKHAVNDFPYGYIEKDSIEGAIKLVEYFLQTSKKVGEIISNPKSEITEKDVLLFIRAKTGHEYKAILEFMKSEVNEGTFRQWKNRIK